MKEGKVVEFDGYTGEIESDNKTYLFLKDHVNDSVNVNDTVTFRGENIKGYDVAFLKKKKNEINDVSLTMKSKENER